MHIHASDLRILPLDHAIGLQAYILLYGSVDPYSRHGKFNIFTIVAKNLQCITQIFDGIHHRFDIVVSVRPFRNDPKAEIYLTIRK